MANLIVDCTRSSWFVPNTMAGSSSKTQSAADSAENQGDDPKLSGAVIALMGAGFVSLVEIRGSEKKPYRAKSRETGDRVNKEMLIYAAEHAISGTQVRLTVWPDDEGKFPVDGLKRGDTGLVVVSGFKGNEATLREFHPMAIDR